MEEVNAILQTSLDLGGLPDSGAHLGFATSILFLENIHPLALHLHMSFHSLNMSPASSTMSHEIWLSSHTKKNTNEYTHEHTYKSKH